MAPKQLLNIDLISSPTFYTLGSEHNKHDWQALCTLKIIMRLCKHAHQVFSKEYKWKKQQGLTHNERNINRKQEPMSTPAERVFLNNANTLEFVKLILQVWLHKKNRYTCAVKGIWQSV